MSCHKRRVHPWKVQVTAPAQSPLRSVAVEAVEVDLSGCPCWRAPADHENMARFAPAPPLLISLEVLHPVG